ncbi:MAG: hypothetical protein AB9M60_09775 [Leptothrix sp. (in: b-proteobacteria)]
MAAQHDFEPAAGMLRFLVPMGQERVTAFISQTTWRSRFGEGQSDANMLEVYLQNQALLDGLVVRKVAAGASRPVVLMACDLDD